MKIANANKSGREFYSSHEDNCADCGEDLDQESVAFIYMRSGEPIFKCQCCEDAIESALLEAIELGLSD